VSEISSAVKIEDISPVKKKLSFDIPWTDVKNELDNVYRKVGRTAKVKGFRPGRIPRAILEVYYREQAEEETVSNIVNRYFWETMNERKIPSVTQPQIEQQGIVKERDFTFSATIEVEPTIDPKDYRGLHLDKEDPAVTEEEFEARLKSIRQMFATMEDISEDRGIADGDFVILDYSGYMDGEPVKELTAENYLLEIGSKTFVPGFEEQLMGAKKGENKSLTVTFPDTYHVSNLAAKLVVFSVAIKEIRVKIVPEMDDNFIKNFEKYGSIDVLKADVRKNLEEEKRRKSEAGFEKYINTEILSRNDFEVPESYIERQIYYMMLDTQRRMVSSGMDPKKAAEFGIKLRDQFREEATRIVKAGLLIRSIAKKEDISVTTDEVDAKIREIAAQRRQDYESLKKSLEKDGLIEDIESEIISKKTYEFLSANATITLVKKDINGIQGVK
jgi:trigger factor